MTYVRAIASSCVPLQLWWSLSDRVVTAHQSARLFREIRALNPDAPVTAYVGSWRHTVAMQASSRLPVALAGLGLLLEPVELFPSDLHSVLPPQSPTWCAPNR